MRYALCIFLLLAACADAPVNAPERRHPVKQLRPAQEAYKAAWIDVRAEYVWGMEIEGMPFEYCMEHATADFELRKDWQTWDDARLTAETATLRGDK